METGRHLSRNQKKLESVTDKDWIRALKTCKTHVVTRLRKRTIFGAHAEARLGMDPIDYYVSFAYDAILDGNWEWKDELTLGQQMTRIAQSCISKEVEKYRTEHDDRITMASEDMDTFFYTDDPPPGEPTLEQEALFSKKITIIEETVKGDENLEIFWECIKDGMKRENIAEFMEKQPKQIDKLREKLIKKIKNSPHFQL